MAGIPTTHRRVNFRSRLEARWAVMFDQLGWSWEYEPIDLEGYIPDFILPFSEPCLVEVRPAFHLHELELAWPKIQASGWCGDVLLVGARLFTDTQAPSFNGFPVVGLTNSGWHPGDLSDGLERALGIICASCRGLAFYDDIGGWRCRPCGAGGKVYRGSAGHDLVELFARKWAEAGNLVQWLRQPPR